MIRAAAEEAASAALGTLCTRCEAYNEPGVERCTTCGYKVAGDGAAKPSGPLEKAPLPDLTPASSGEPTLSEELRGLALSAEEAADAGLRFGDDAPDDAPVPVPEQPARAPLPRGWAAAEAAIAQDTQGRRAAPATGCRTSVARPP